MYIWIIHTNRIIQDNIVIAVHKDINLKPKAFKYVTAAKRFIEDNYDGSFYFRWRDDDEKVYIIDVYAYKKEWGEERITNLWIEEVEIDL